jgi:hypothetical protein
MNGLTTERNIEKILDNIFSRKHCPLSAKIFLGHKYLLPNYRAPDYFNQDFLNQSSLLHMILATAPGAEEKIDEVSRGVIFNIMSAVKCGRPTMFLEKELGEILLDSRLPDDIKTTDIKRQFPSFRIMLPRKLLTIDRNGETDSLMFIDIGFLEEGEEATCPKDIAHELDMNSIRRWGPYEERMRLSSLSYYYKEAALIITGTISHGWDADLPTCYGISVPWRSERLREILTYRGDLNTPWPTDDLDKVFMRKMENLVLNILLLLSIVPVAYEPEHIERKARLEGKRMIPALLRARWVGDHLVKARQDGRVRGEVVGSRHNTPHWVRPHWRRQRFGLKLGQARLIWLLPYHRGDNE